MEIELKALLPVAKLTALVCVVVWLASMIRPDRAAMSEVSQSFKTPATQVRTIPAYQLTTVGDNSLTSNQAVTLADVREICAPGKTQCLIFSEAAMPSDIRQIADVLKASFGEKNVDWLSQRVEGRCPGVPIPYDSKFGVTEAQYRRFIDYNQRGHCSYSGDGVLEFRQASESIIQIVDINGLQEFDGIVIDLDKNQITTPFGVAVKNENHVFESHTIDALGAYCWWLNKGSIASGNLCALKFWVGRTSTTGHDVIGFRVHSLIDGKLAQNVQKVIAIKR